MLWKLAVKSPDNRICVFSCHLYWEGVCVGGEAGRWWPWSLSAGVWDRRVVPGKLTGIGGGWGGEGGNKRMGRREVT